MIDYGKVRVGDVLRIIGDGAPGYAEIGDLVRVASVSKNGVKIENKRGIAGEFVFACGAARLEATAFKEPIPGDHSQPACM
jgi:hypothetical protein